MFKKTKTYAPPTSKGQRIRSRSIQEAQKKANFLAIPNIIKEFKNAMFNLTADLYPMTDPFKKSIVTVTAFPLSSPYAPNTMDIQYSIEPIEFEAELTLEAKTGVIAGPPAAFSWPDLNDIVAEWNRKTKFGQRSKLFNEVENLKPQTEQQTDYQKAILQLMQKDLDSYTGVASPTATGTSTPSTTSTPLTSTQKQRGLTQDISSPVRTKTYALRATHVVLPAILSNDKDYVDDVNKFTGYASKADLNKMDDIIIDVQKRRKALEDASNDASKTDRIRALASRKLKAVEELLGKMARISKDIYTKNNPKKP